VAVESGSMSGMMSSRGCHSEISSTRSNVLAGMPEEFFAISVDRLITHPCVAAISHAARGKLLGA